MACSERAALIAETRCASGWDWGKPEHLGHQQSDQQPWEGEGPVESQADLIGGEGELGKLPRGAHNLPGRSRSQGHLGKKALEDVQEELQTGTRIQFWTWRRTRLHCECRL